MTVASLLAGYQRYNPIRRSDSALLILSGVYFAFVYAVAIAVDAEQFIVYYSYSTLIAFVVISGLFVLAVVHLLRLAFIERERSPIARMLRDLRDHVLKPERIAAFGVPVAAIALAGSAYMSFKAIFPVFAPFNWDLAFYELDRVLHFGVDPWRITHALFGDPLSTYLISFNYQFWFMAMWLGLLIAVIAVNKPRERAQFLISFVLCWGVLGSALAALLSSAGPVYFERIGAGGDVYAELFARLEAIDSYLRANTPTGKIAALGVQEYLWSHYADETPGLGAGISAMPSMHLSIATLLALGARHVGPTIFKAAVIFVVLIQIGSVHLGWHYAVDGYLSIIATILIWKIVGRYLHARDSVSDRLSYGSPR